MLMILPVTAFSYVLWQWRCVKILVNADTCVAQKFPIKLAHPRRPSPVPLVGSAARKAGSPPGGQRTLHRTAKPGYVLCQLAGNLCQLAQVYQQPSASLL